jgi:type IV secretory pathway VirB2 component (pilin)
MKLATQLIALTCGLLLAGGHAAAQTTQTTQTTQTAQLGYSAPLLFNLANSYARAGKPGMAVLNYERAKLLSPYDSDIEQNLNIVQSAAQVPTTAASSFERIARIVSPQLASWIGVLGVAIVGLSVLSGRLSRRRRWLRWSATLLGMTMISLTVANGVVLWPTLHEGVVIASATPVRVSPAPLGDSIFELAEAAAVKVLAEHEGFILVQAGDGRSGWVARSTVAAVVPRGAASSL